MSLLLSRKNQFNKEVRMYSIYLISIYSMKKLEHLGLINASGLIIFENVNLPAKIAFIKDEIDEKNKLFYKVTYICIRELRSIRRIKPFISNENSLYVILLNKWLVLSAKLLKKLFVFLKVIPSNSKVIFSLLDVSMKDISAIVKKAEQVLKKKVIIISVNKHFSSPYEFFRKVVFLNESSPCFSIFYRYKGEDNALNQSTNDYYHGGNYNEN